MLRRVDRRHLDRRHYSWSGRIQEDHSRYHRAAARNDALTRRNLKCVQELSPVNARGTLICKMNISDSPSVAALPGRFLPDLDRRRKPRGPFFEQVARWGGPVTAKHC